MTMRGEKVWLTDPGGLVEIEAGGNRYYIVEQEWADLAGDTTDQILAQDNGSAFATSPSPGTWTVVYAANPNRVEAYVANVDSNPKAIVFAAGSAFGIKPLYPDGPGLVLSDAKGEVAVMAPDYPSVRLSRAQI